MFKTHPFFAGPYIMGVLNVTPDSFSDGGKFFNQNKAVDRAIQMVQEGADIIDIGGESSRPGAQPIEIEEEIRRVVPIVKALSGNVPWISVDTRNARTMFAVLEAGANIINDISALSHDRESVKVLSDSDALIILMHMQGTPIIMQDNPMYNNVIDDIFDELNKRISLCNAHRIENHRLIIDPGIGFGKKLNHNLVILRYIKKFFDLGMPVCLGSSRKRFIGEISGECSEGDRLAGSLSSVLWAFSQGVQIFRVHDVKETRQALDVWSAIDSIA